MMSGKRYAIAADVVFDGATSRRDGAVVIEGETIAAVAPRGELPDSIEIWEAPRGAWLAPGFIDIQVNGGGDVLFNADPTPEGVATIVAAHRKLGATSILPTLITDTDEKMAAAMNAVEIMLDREPGVLGLHLEGPFLSPQKPGVHRGDLIRRPEPHHEQMLTSFKEGVLLVTLAPEQTPAGFIGRLAAAGARIALGHSLASYEETCAAMREGLTGFTHLFNAMPPLSAREPGPVAAALEQANAYYGLIVDGWHVAAPMLRLALRGAGHAMLVSDAMPPVGGIESEFMLQGSRIRVEDGRCATAQGVLAGSAIGISTAVGNCVRLLGTTLDHAAFERDRSNAETGIDSGRLDRASCDEPIPNFSHRALEQAQRLASAEPADFLGLGHWLGRLSPGYRADIVAFEPGDMTIIVCWVAGKRFDA